MGNDFHTLADEYLLSAFFLSCLPASIYFGIVVHIYKYKYIKCQDTQQNCDFSSGKSKLQSLQKSKICTGKILNLTSRDHNFVFPRILFFFLLVGFEILPDFDLYPDIYMCIYLHIGLCQPRGVVCVTVSTLLHSVCTLGLGKVFPA